LVVCCCNTYLHPHHNAYNYADPRSSAGYAAVSGADFDDDQYTAIYHDANAYNHAKSDHNSSREYFDTSVDDNSSAESAYQLHYAAFVESAPQ
jgi:hypothetical protein